MPIKGRPIAVKFVSKNDAEMVLKNKNKLSEGIFVDRLYSTEMEMEHKRLRPILSAACRLEEYRGKCKMEGTDLIICGKWYSFENLSELPQNLSPEVVSCHQDASHYGFFGEFNPLLNFHPAVFTYNGTCYSHTEQFIQATKAEFCKDTETLNAILSTTSALKCKELGRLSKKTVIFMSGIKKQRSCVSLVSCVSFSKTLVLLPSWKIQGIKSCLSVVMIKFGVMAYLFLARTALLLTSTSIKASKERCSKRYGLSFILHAAIPCGINSKWKWPARCVSPTCGNSTLSTWLKLLQSSYLTMLHQTNRLTTWNWNGSQLSH